MGSQIESRSEAVFLSIAKDIVTFIGSSRPEALIRRRDTEATNHRLPLPYSN
jgi:hypothetical protein